MHEGCLNIGEMEIAPRVSAAVWKTLNLDDASHPDWFKACEILRARLHERFIDPADLLIAAEDLKPAAERRFGFVVLGLDCLLVETMAAFREGLLDTRWKSEAAFCRFLTKRPSFASAFPDVAVAKRFYEEFRCGILHQAEVGGTSLVWSVGPLIQDDGKRLIVNRNEFHTRLKVEFAGYLDELRAGGDTDLRDNFRTKMTFIAR